MKKKGIDSRNRPGSHFTMTVLLAGLLLIFPAFAAQEQEDVQRSIVGIGILVLLLVILGFGLGTFAFLANHIFPKRSATSYRVMCVRPGLSFLLGFIITLIGFGLLAVFGPIPSIQFLVLLAYMAGLLMFAAGATTRYVAHLVESSMMKNGIPGPLAHIKGGLILCLANILPILGTLLFLGILLAGVGATLLGYFAAMGKAAASITTVDEDQKE
jgi:hypothetical protein